MTMVIYQMEKKANSLIIKLNNNNNLKLIKKKSLKNLKII